MNKLNLIIVFLFFGNLVFGQTSYADLPKQEWRPYFKFDAFPRGFDEKKIDSSLNYLQKKDPLLWNSEDSLQFMNDLILIGRYNTAYQIYLKLNLDTIRNEEMIHTIQFMMLKKEKYARLSAWYQWEKVVIPKHTKAIQIRARIADARQKISQKDWSFKDSVLFPIFLDDKWNFMKKGDADYLKELIPLVQNFNEALRLEVKYETEENKALAQAFVELGKFINKHVDYTDAFIAYNCARFYSRKSMFIAKKIRESKSELQDKNLLLPSFRQIFPKQSKGIFNYQIIKEKIKQREGDTIKDKVEPLKMIPIDKKHELFPFMNKDLVLILGLFLILIAVVIFVRPRKRNKD